MGRIGAWLGAAAAVGVTLWLLFTHDSSNLERVLTDYMGAHTDFDTFHRSAVALLRGESIYDTGAWVANLNPPFWTVLLAPLGLTDTLTAYRVFSVITAVLVIGAGFLVARELRVPHWTKWIVLAAFLVSSPLMGTVALGQVYGVLVAGLAVAWVLQKRGRHVGAGIALGIVIAIKPTLIPILLLPVVQRQWKTFQAGVLAGAAATLIGVAAAGVQAFLRWMEVLKAEQLSTFSDNASLPSFVARLGGPAWIGFLTGAVLLIYTLRKVRNDPDMALWAVTAATLLLSPVAWHNYLVLCFPGVFVVLRHRQFATAALLITLPLIGVEWNTAFWQGDGFVDHVGQSFYCFILLTYWYALAVQHNRDDPGQVRQPGDLGGAEHRPARAADQ